MNLFQDFGADMHEHCHQFYYKILGDQPKNLSDEKISPKTNFDPHIDDYLDDFFWEREQKRESNPIKVQDGIKGVPLSGLEIEKVGDSMLQVKKAQTRKLKEKMVRKASDCTTVPKIQQQENSFEKTTARLISRFVLQEVPIKKATKKFAISKFLVRMFLKYEQDFLSEADCLHYNTLLSQEFQNKKENKFNLERDIARIFGYNGHDFDERANRHNRKIMAGLLRGRVKEEVIMNSFTEKNRLSYMMGIKTYALRCRCKQLVKKASYR